MSVNWTQVLPAFTLWSMLTLRQSTISLCLLCACQAPPSSDVDEFAGADRGYGRIHLGIHDDPLTVDGHVISSIVVTVEEVHLRGPEGWIEIDGGSHVLDILELQGGLVAWLGAANIPAGHYDQIRLVISEAQAIVDGQEVELTIPSAYTSGIKIETDMLVEPNQALWVQLDFDLDDSVHQAGNGEWLMKPVIKLDDVLTKDDVVAVAQVQEGSPTELSLPDGAHVMIEDGALPDGTVVSLERIVDEPAGMNPSPVYEVLPSGPLSGLATVTLPFYELPPGMVAQDLEMSVDHRLVTAVVDEGGSTLTASVDHFCEFTSSPKRDVLLAHTRVRRPNDAVQVWADLACSSPWIAAQIDLSANGVSLDVHTGAVKDAGGAGRQDDRYEGLTLEELAPQTVDFAVNTVEFEEYLGLDRVSPARTTRIGGENYYIEGGAGRRAELLIHAEAEHYAAQIEASPAPHGDDWKNPETLDIALGSLAAVAWSGEYRDSYDLPNAQPCTTDLPECEAWKKLPYDYKKKDPWTMAGVSDDGETLMFMVFGSANLPTIYHHAKTIFAGELHRALLFDGGGSATAVVDGVAAYPTWGIDDIFAGLSATTPCSPMEFDDVPQGAWFRPHVRTLMCAGVIDNADHFRPFESTTRAEFLRVTLETAFPTMIFAGVADEDFDDFADVHYQAWYARYVEFAEAKGIIDGYEINGKSYFKPDQPVTRAEAAKMLVMVGKVSANARYGAIYEFYGNLGVVPQADRFEDTQNHWAYEFIHALRLFDGADAGSVRDGIVCGYTDPVTKELTNEFHPDDDLLRAEMAKMICIAAGYCAAQSCG